MRRSHLGPRLAGALSLWAFAMLLACAETGGSTGERTPGGGTNVDPTSGRPAFRDDAGTLRVQGPGDAAIAVFDDAGALNPGAASLGRLAVDDRDESVYVLQAFPTRAFVKEIDGGVSFESFGVKTLYVVRPGAAPQELLNLDGVDATRALFPADGVLMAANRSNESAGCRTTLALWNVGATTLRSLRVASTCLGVGELSPSRRWATVTSSDRAAPTELGLLDAATLTVGRLGDVAAFGAPRSHAWLHRRDALVTYVGGADVARVDLWNLADVTSAQVSSPSVPTGREGGASFSLRPSTQVTPDLLQVSPDDRLAVLSSSDYPVIRFDGTQPEKHLYLVDLPGGEPWQVDRALGPVAFTPDDSTVVAWRNTRDSGGAVARLPDGGLLRSEASLVFVDRATHARTELPIPLAGTPLFFVTRTGHRVLVSGATGGLVVYDMQMGRFSASFGAAAPLDNFVSRDEGRELWQAHGGLWRIAVLDDAVERVEPGWAPTQINLLPRSDQLVLDRPYENALSFWNPVTRETVRTVPLPVPARRGP